MLAAWLPEEPSSPHGVMHDFPQFLDGPDRPIPRSARLAARPRGDYVRRIARTATRPPCLRWGQLPASATAAAARGGGPPPRGRGGASRARGGDDEDPGGQPGGVARRADGDSTPAPLQ